MLDRESVRAYIRYWIIYSGAFMLLGVLTGKWVGIKAAATLIYVLFVYITAATLLIAVILWAFESKRDE